MPIAPVAATRRLQRLINLNETLTLAPEGGRRATTAARNLQFSLSHPRRERAVQVKLALEIQRRIEFLLHPSAGRRAHGHDAGVGKLGKARQRSASASTSPVG